MPDHLHAKLVALAACALTLAVAVASPPHARAADPGMTFALRQAAVPLVERQVCSLLDKTTGNGASITGQDEVGSLKVGDTTYWVFGDTGLSGGHPQIPNNIGVTSDGDASDCIQLRHKAASGVALPLLPVSGDPDEATVWPTGMVAAVPGVVHFFYTSITIAQQPFALRFLGLGKFDMATLSGVRLGSDPVLGTSFWSPAYGISAARPLLVDGTVYVFLGTSSGNNSEVKLARVAPDRIEDVSAYTYWAAGTQSWVPDFGRADAIISEFLGQLPSEVSWNAFLGKWTMVYTAGLGAREVMRVADRLTGPWSAPSALFDCRQTYPGPGPLGTYCYSGQGHDELLASGGETVYATVSNEIDYRVFMHRIKLAVAVDQYVNAEGQRAYVAEGDPVPAGFGPAEGVAFYAGRSADPALTAIHEWQSGQEIVYAASPPSVTYADQGVAFYAPMWPTVTYTPLSPGMVPVNRTAYEPVYRWDRPGAQGGPPQHVYSQYASVPGYTRGSIAFYAPCPDTDGDGADDCVESAQGSDPLNPDTDGDGHNDAPPPAGVMVAAPDPAYDNCPAAYNPGQENHDSNFIDLSRYGKAFNDLTWPNSDGLGDACDPDADNDGLSNAAERSLPGPACPSASGPTDPLSRDTDGDLVLDGAECALGTDPADAASVPPAYLDGDTDRDGLSDWFEALMGTDPFKFDTDGDRVSDGVEFKNYNTDPLNRNTDGDACTDGREIASIDLNAAVTSGDSSQLVRSWGPSAAAGYIADFDLNKDGWINSSDLLFGARQYGYCP